MTVARPQRAGGGRGSRIHSGRPKSASEQAGNSFRYLYWRLSEKDFQQLCAALLRHKLESVQSFPVGMADEGIDAISTGSVIYQVKWTSKFEQDPSRWLSDAIDRERPKILRLIEQGRISRYVLMTSVAGTTTAKRTGSIQKLQDKLNGYSEEFGIPVECWWQSDIDAAVDEAPDSIKWSYQEMLAGTQAIRYLIFGAQLEADAARMRDTVLRVMAAQWREDAKVKFSQVDMDRVNLAEMFVDVQASLVAPPRRAETEFRATRNEATNNPPAGAVHQLLRTAVPLTFLLGVPGQGKSTLGQYLCQIHRAAILPEEMVDGHQRPREAISEPKLPIRIDLKDYAAWISGRDPFADEEPAKRPKRRPKSTRSLETFLAAFCSTLGGGRTVEVGEIHSLLDRYPTLLMLDGLDEVADPLLRSIVVEEIDQASARMGAVSQRLRRFQIVVTSRPNASGLAEPDGEIFQRVRLLPLSKTLQSEYVVKWCDANGVEGKARQNLRRIFRDRTALDHVAQLADNPMQLTILLFLINRKGEAVPVSRTPLYTEYMTTLLDREVNRQQIDRDQVPSVQEVTAFLGWHMHSGVETAAAAGRMSQQDIETALIIYFRQTGNSEEQATTLFKAASDRFWALTSKVEGTFEFAVQPVREYFAARFLAEWAGRERREPLPKQAVLQELVERPYWLNTARFYAGFASPNELAALRYGLEDALSAARHPLQERVATWTLLSDGVFANAPRVQRDVVNLLTDDLSINLISPYSSNEANFPRLPLGTTRDQFAEALRSQIETRPRHILNLARVKLLRDRAGVDRESFAGWWLPRLQDAVGTADATTWLKIGAAYGPQRIPSEVVDKLDLSEVAAQQAALAAGVSPEHDTDAARQLLSAVLGGHASDLRCGPASEAGALLRAMRPQWFHRINVDHTTRVPAGNGHLWLTEVDKSVRAAAWKRLLEINPRYAALKKAARVRQLSQTGTTEPWQNPARELTRLHGPSWLAAEIAIAGAAARGTHAAGTIGRDGEPFGQNVDYGTFVIAVHRQPNTEWWESTHGQYSDALSRRTWALALVATASETIVSEQIERIDAVLAGLSDEDFAATAASSSRIALSGSARSVAPKFVQGLLNVHPRTQLLLAHFCARSGSRALSALPERELASIASPHPSAWPVSVEISARLLEQPRSTLLEALTALAPAQSVGPEPNLSSLPGDYIDKILRDPGRLPAEWVAAAEQQRSTLSAESTLEQLALTEKWLPRVPRF